jgi:uncharacterized protein
MLRLRFPDQREGEERTLTRIVSIRAGRVARLLLLAMVAACGDREAERSTEAAPPPVQWERAEIAIRTATDSIPLQVEISETDEQRAYGLMNRSSLPETSGMLFVYEAAQPAEGSFWMFNTRIPLDIAFLDGDGTIVSIRQMEPCASPYPQWCPSYEAGAPFQHALEVNLGWFERHRVAVGDRVILPR